MPANRPHAGGVDLYEFTVPDLGIWLGQGAWRHVFADPHDPQCVIKIAGWNGRGSGRLEGSRENNLTEVQVWNTVKNTELERWFAPVFDHDPEGHWIRSARLTKIGRTKGIKARADFVAEGWLEHDMIHSWGMWQQRPVIFDTGNAAAYKAVCKRLGIDTDT